MNLRNTQLSESSFNLVQQLKTEHPTEVFFKDIDKATRNAAFGTEGNLKTDLKGPYVKIGYLAVAQNG